MAEQQQQLATDSGAGMTTAVSTAAVTADANVNVSELGKALDQATISSTASAAASPADSRYTGTGDGGDDDDDEPDEGDEEDDYEEDEDEDEDDESNAYGDDGDFGMADMTNDDDDDYEGDDVAASPIKLESIANAAPLKSKSPKKRGRTDSLKKMLPAPASQRHKQKNDGSGTTGASSSGGAAVGALSSELNSSAAGCDVDTFGASKTPPAKLLVKDRTGAGMGVPRPHLISNAVKQAPPAKEKSNPRRWSKHEDESLRLAVERSGERNWKAIADQVPGRNHTQCLQRWTKVLKPGLIKGHWTPEEDSKLRELVTEEKKNWGQVASLIPGRTSKQCRERWCNHLDPNINKGSYTEDEDKIIIEMQSKLGNRWSIIAQQLKGRTEDAVKIRWKSLMRGRRAAMKDEKHHSAPPSAAAAAAATASTQLSASVSVTLMTNSAAPLSGDKAKARAAKAPPSRQKTRAASPVVKTEKPTPSPLPAAAVAPATSSGVDKVATAAAASSHAASLTPAMLELQPAELSLDGDGKLDGLDLAAAIGVTDDLVAASLQGFQMNPRYQSSAALNGGLAIGGGVYPPTTLSQTISPANHAMYTASNGYGVNTVAPPSAYAMQQHAYGAMPQSATMPQSYAMQQHAYGAPPQMAMAGPMQYYSGVSSAMAPPNGYSQSGYGVPRQMYQNYASGGGGGNMYPPPPASVPMTAQNFTGMPASMYGGGSFSGSAMAPPAGNSNSAGLSNAVGGMHVGLPPSSAAAAAKMLNTPREEWGSSQTPRSQMILTEGHASAYELFHQQRVRLMLQERDKSGLTLSSAPSPGQALLTKELEANKERQKRQAIMQKGWKSAVEAMMASSDLSSLDDQQRFDGFLEKVTLSALDPTDDELISDIIADDSLDVETPVG